MGTIETAFGANFSIYRNGNSTFYSNAADIQLPTSIGSMVRTVVGLHNLTLMKLSLDHRYSVTNVDPTYAPADIRTAYDDSRLVDTPSLGYNGAGQTIDILDVYDYLIFSAT